VQPIDWNELAKNREKVVAWQTEAWSKKKDGLRLHLGSGHIHLSGYVNVDPYTDEADVKEDMRYISFPPNSAIEIVSHHALEHIPQRDVLPTLRLWYDTLAPGGTLEVGIPDVELCAQAFLEASESQRWGNYIWTIYGWQAHADGTGFSPGQIHMAGFSLGYFVRILEDIGFRMLDAFNYDGNGTPSLFVYAEKPNIKSAPKLLEQDVVIGTFTNKSTQITKLWESAHKHVPNVKFITRFHRGGINAGMSLLREDFLATGKRYWVFLDDDIQFLNPDIINNALRTLISGKYGAVSVYSTFDTESLTKPYDASKLVAREARWATGYFIMVDSHKVGQVLPDMNLPDANTSIDTSYSVSIRAAGYNIGISPDYVYHFKKEVWMKPDVVEITNKYLMKKWGKFYFDICQYDHNVIDWG
jgi:glycosyltransferase involved in cell wall biosynthesis